MKREDISEALTSVSERYVEESRPRAKRPVRWGWIATAAAVLLVAVFGGWFGVKAILGRENGRTVYTDPTAAPIATAAADPTARPSAFAGPLMLASAEYPATPGLAGDGYYTYERALRERGVFGAGEDLAGFYARLAGELLEDGKNGVFSPYNVYMALAMLAEITDGNTRSQILGLLGSGSIGELREQYGRLFDANYRNADDCIMLMPAASIWLRDGYVYNADAIEALKSAYRASSGSGTMGDPAYDALIESWINEMTHGLLADSAKDAAATTPDEVMKLISTLYYKASWSTEFGRETYEGVFHGKSGDRTVEFMSGAAGLCYRMDGYTLVGKGLTGGGIMWFVLPDEGVELDGLVKSGAPLAAVLDRSSLSEEVLYDNIFLNMPKLDVSSSYSLIEALERLGVTDCFDASSADFSPLSNDSLFVSKIRHSARLIADTKGVEAAAFTVIDVTYGGLLTDITVTLDRPFMFIVTSADNTPLFVGTQYDF